MNGTIPAAEVSELALLLKTIFALLFVVALIYISSAVARKYGLDKRMAGVKGTEKTLAVEETLYLDPRRRVVKITDGTDCHLLLLGPVGDMVIASKSGENRHEGK